MRAAIAVRLLGCAIAACVAPTFLHPWGDLRARSAKTAPILKGSNVPADVRDILERKCGDCHSEATRWPVYSRVAPVSWLIEKDVHDGRRALNLSRWDEYDTSAKMDLLARIASEARGGQMPPPTYLRIHRGLRLSEAEQEQIYQWARAARKRLREQGSQ